MNYALLLFWLSVITGVLWVIDTFYWKKERVRDAQSAKREFDEANAEALSRRDASVLAEEKKLVKEKMKQPLWLEYTAGLFWVIFCVFLFRSFLFEPFRIPSGSMLPTLHIGDFILVNKFEYGIRLPVIDRKIINVGSPKRGDVVVFKYPISPDIDYIKRVVGLPGDKVTYVDKKLYVNGELMEQTGGEDWVAPDTHMTLTKHAEKLGNVEHMMTVDERRPAGLLSAPYARAQTCCMYQENGFSCVVPKDSYFMMGDNRDNSEDSRYWGVVPDKYLVGRAFFVWANFSDFSRFGTSFK